MHRQILSRAFTYRSVRDQWCGTGAMLPMRTRSMRSVARMIGDRGGTLLPRPRRSAAPLQDRGQFVLELVELGGARHLFAWLEERQVASGHDLGGVGFRHQGGAAARHFL